MNEGKEDQKNLKIIISLIIIFSGGAMAYAMVFRETVPLLLIEMFFYFLFAANATLSYYAKKANGLTKYMLLKTVISGATALVIFAQLHI